MPRSPQTARSAVLLLALAMILTLVLTGQAGTATAATAGGGGYPVEDYPGYQPQTRCSPNAKPGTEMLAKWLQRKYPGTGSLGISRSCGGGGASEHKEGRAFDWAVSAGSARDRGYVRDFVTLLREPDGAGNPAALARRMGIMYFIWNDHIYSAWNHYQRTDYRHSACKRLKNCSASLRHRNHVHISLTRQAAKGLTSWYLKRAGVPAPLPAPEPLPEPEPTPEPSPMPQRAPRDGTLDLNEQPYVRLGVRADGTVRESRFRLRGGTGYVITAAGLFGYGGPRQVADAACVWSPAAAGWVRRPADSAKRRHGSLELTVNGQRLFDTDCRGSHVYRTTFTPRTTGTLKLRVDNRPAGASGRLVVTVSRRGADVREALPTYPTLRAAPAVPDALGGHGLLAETVSIPGTAVAVRTRTALNAGAAYRLTVAGKVRLGGAHHTDGVCVSAAGTWYRQTSLDRRVPDQAHGRLYVDGVPLEAAGGCTTRRHTVDFTARRDGRLQLALWDPVDRRDNKGSLTVRLQRLSDVGTPRPGPKARPRRSEPWQQRRDWVQVATNASTGSLTALRLRKGERVTLVVRGTFRSGEHTADAACVSTGSGWLRRDPGFLVAQDPFELWVDGQPVGWRALGKDDVCSAEHGYTARFTATKNGPLRLAVLDVDHGDNSGTLDVTVLR